MVDSRRPAGSPPQTGLVVNGLFTRQPLTGVQRYAREVVGRLPLKHRVEAPAAGLPLSRISHHLWEQAILPLSVPRAGLLWSPTGTGPILMRRQAVTLHDASLLSHPEWFSSWYVAWRRMTMPRLVRSAARVITVSEFAAEHIRERLDVETSKIRVVPNGVDHERFAPVPEPRIREVRAKLELPEQYVLAVGTLEPRKNHRRLLEAWRRLNPEIRGDCALALAGGSSRNFRNSPLPGAPGLRLLGRVKDEDLPGLYAGAVAVAYPSLFEGFGLPVLEAMAVGTPVLTSSVSALPEVAGDAAILVDPEEVEEIIGGLSRLLADSDLRSQLKEAGFRRAQRFSWDRTASETGQVLREVLEGDASLPRPADDAQAGSSPAAPAGDRGDQK